MDAITKVSKDTYENKREYRYPVLMLSKICDMGNKFLCSDA